ncbi:hypothetical protein DV735_g4913, partial [Chaetothyriales sp. CBS 134920]
MRADLFFSTERKHYMALPILFALLQSYAFTVSATVLVYNASLPTTLTSTCLDALLSDVTACDPLVKNLRPDFFYPPASLARICTEDCLSGLSTWMSSVQTSCGNQTVVGDVNVEAAAAFIPGSLLYSFELACLQEDGRYCGPVAALAAAIADPGRSLFNYISDVTEADVMPESCDICLVERLRLRAGSPYFDGPAVASMSVYESLTSSCSITGRPIATTTIDYFTATPTPTASICDGETYTIQASDDCYTISKSQGVGTAWLLADNDLEASCSNFPPMGTSLCITNKCTTVTVGVNETCSAIARAANITETQFHAWNPVINYACTNLNTMNGTEVCVDAPGRKFTPPTDTSGLPLITPTAAVPMPTDAAEGSGDQPCGRWYTVQQGDYCNLLTVKFGITLEEFLFLNTGVNKNCTNLFAEESYCVQAVGDINTYSGRPGYMTITLDPSATFTGVPFTALPDATGSPYSRLYTPVPIATGTRDDCVHYFDGADYQVNVIGTSFLSPCSLAIAVYGVDSESFAAWNPGLGDVLSPSCAFEAGLRYCGSWYLQKSDVTSQTVTTATTTTSADTTSPTPPGPTMSGSPADCNEWALVEEGVTCTDMATNAGITLEQFLAWNPAVSSDCLTNYWLGEAYCVGVASSSATTTTSSATSTTSADATSPTPPGPTMSGSPADCNEWALVEEGVTCTDMATNAGITLEQFLAWNPAVSSDCLTNYWLGEAYCVGVASSSATTTTSSATSTTSADATSPTPPGPTMSGSPADCNEWALVEEGVTCTDMATNAGITLEQFLAWNPAVSSDCLTNYWLGEAYCVGVASSSSTTTQPGTTTTTTTAPSVTKPPSEYLQAGQPDDCNKWDRCVSGDYCALLAERNGLTVSELAMLNPVLGVDGADCASQMWLDYYYCVSELA